MEDYVERFEYTLQRFAYVELDKNILKIILIKGMTYESLNMLNLMGKGDISKESYNTIWELCVRCSRGDIRNKPGTRDTLGSGVTREEIDVLLDNFKANILSTLSPQLDLL